MGIEPQQVQQLGSSVVRMMLTLGFFLGYDCSNPNDIRWWYFAIINFVAIDRGQNATVKPRKSSLPLLVSFFHFRPR